MKRFIALLAICVVGMLFGAVPLKWTVDAEKVTPVAFDAYHGETLAFEATLKSYGKVIQGVSNAVLYHQTNGMGNVWWQTSASVSNGIVKASFTPAMDTGADRVAFFLGVTDAAGSNYRASGQIRFKPSPGFNPSTLDVPAMQRLNLSQVEVVNAPWATMADIDAVFARKSDIPAIPDMSEYVTENRFGQRLNLEHDYFNDLYVLLDSNLDNVNVRLDAIPPPPDLSPYALRSELPVVPDLTGYATHGDVATNVANATENLNDRISSLNEQLATLGDAVVSNAVAIANVDMSVDLTNYAQLSDIPDPPDLSGYATHNDVATNIANFATQIRSEMEAFSPTPDMTGYARLEDIPPPVDLTNYAQLSDIPDPPDLSGYATHGDVATNVANAAENLNERISSLNDQLTSLGEAVSSNAVAIANFDVNVDLTNYAQLSDIPDPPDLSGYATHGDVATNIASAVGIVSVRADGLSDRISATETAISANADAIEENARAIAAIPPLPDMRDYALREEIPFERNLANYVQTNVFTDATNYLCLKIDDAASRIPTNFLGKSDWVHMVPFEEESVLAGWDGITSEFVSRDWFDVIYNGMLTDASITSVASEYFFDNSIGVFGAMVRFEDKFHSVDGSISVVSNRVDAWEGFLGGDDVSAEVTNYYGTADAPAFLLKQKMAPDSTHVSSWHKTIWDERTRWNRFFSGQWASLTNTVVTYLAERCWGIYDSSTGNHSPDGVLQISQRNIQISDGMSYQKTVSVGGAALWVVTANDPTVLSGNPETGFFKIHDGDGNALFEIVRGDKKIVGAFATETDVMPGNVFRIRYNTISSEHPVLELSREFGKNANFLKEDDPELDFATVTWSGSSGNWNAQVVAPGERILFARASFETGGETYIRNHAPISTDKIVIGGTNYNVKTEVISVNGVQKRIMVLEL